MLPNHVGIDTVAFLGGAVKALGNDKIGGILVPYGDPKTLDADGEYFDAATDFGGDVTTRARVVYHHGFTKALGSRKLGVVEWELGDAGVMCTGTLDTRDKATKAIYGDAEAGKLFWSSGSTERLTVKERKGSAVRIACWPICEASLTGSPVNRRAKAYAVKAMDSMGPEAAMSAISSMHYSTMSAVRGHMTDEKMTRAQRLAACKKCMQKHAITSMRAVNALMDPDGDDDADAMKAIFDGLDAEPSLDERSDWLVADAEELHALFSRFASQRAEQGRSLSPTKRTAIKAIASQISSLVAGLPEDDAERRRRLRLRLLQERI